MHTRHSSKLASRSQLVLALHAQQMRSYLTPSEERLWQAVRASQLGVVFHRQVVVLERYVVDFLAPSIRLVIEVDGSCHALKRASDQRRTAKLERDGYRVLRLDARLVLRDLPRPIALVRAASRSAAAEPAPATSPCCTEGAGSRRLSTALGEVGARSATGGGNPFNLAKLQ
jgi:very-short-patch-repair endonuclease